MNQPALDMLIDLATERRDAAAAELGKLRGQHSASQAQLSALVTYRKEYAERLAQAMSSGISMHQLENDQRFLAAIDEAVQRQQEVVAQNANRVVGGQSDWQDKQRRLKSFSTLTERNRTKAAQESLRREQRATDEFAGHMMRGARASGGARGASMT